MGTGPRATFGYDIALTEVLEDGRRYYVAESGTDRGAELLAMIPGAPGDQRGDRVERARRRANGSVDGTAARHRRSAELLAANREHPRWDEVAERCLTCGNCTMVCPTCFCTTVEDVTDLTGTEAERRQVWDSCFTLDFSYVHGGGVRSSPRGRATGTG